MSGSFQFHGGSDTVVDGGVRRQLVMAEMVLQIEVRVVYPGWVRNVHRYRRKLAAIGGNEVHAALEMGKHFVVGELSLNDDDGRDMHGTAGSLQV